MQDRDAASRTIEAELNVRAATAELVHFDLPEPIHDLVRDRDEGAYRIDLCLTPRPRNAFGCYRDRWGPNRFERIGHLYVAPPGETLFARSDGGRQTSILCHLRAESIRTWFDRDLDWTPRRLEASLDVPSAEMRGLLLRLADEARHPGFASELLIELIAGQLAIELTRYCHAIDGDSTSGGLATWRLRLIDERLREVREAPTLSELARLCGLSVRQLTRSFRKSRGSSIGDHVAASRVEHAKHLLATGETIKAIGYSLGFSTPSAFSYAFRRATGQTPRQFRNDENRTKRGR